MSPGRRRMLIAAGLIALAGLAYLWYRSRSGSSAAPSGTSPFSTGATTSQPAASGDAGAGGDSGGGSGSASDVLGALAGENQQLLNQLLSTSNSLAPSFGSGPPAFATTIPGSGAAPQSIAASPQPISRTDTSTSPVSPGSTPVPLLSTSTIDTGADAGGVIYTPSSPAAAAAIDSSPNALTQIGSDAAQAGAGITVPPATTTTSVEQTTLAGSYGGGKTSGQVKKNL